MKLKYTKYPIMFVWCLMLGCTMDSAVKSAYQSGSLGACYCQGMKCNEITAASGNAAVKIEELEKLRSIEIKER